MYNLQSIHLCCLLTFMPRMMLLHILLQSCYVILQHCPPSTTIYIFVLPSFFSLNIPLIHVLYLMYPVPFRSAVLRAFSFLRNFRLLSRIFHIAPSTIYRWTLSPLPSSSSRPSKITPHLILFIRNTLEKYPFVSCTSLRFMISHVFRFEMRTP